MGQLIVVSDDDDLIHKGVGLILESARQAFTQRGVFRFCLAGGSTPRKIYRQLAEEQTIIDLNRPGLVLYWGDERCVQPDDPRSNYKMARDELICHLDTETVSVHRMEGEAHPPQAAAHYENLLRSHFPLHNEPTFDLLLLGMGEDGHTASLFPFTGAVNESSRWVIGQYIPQLAGWRITLTPPILNRARRIIFLVSGEAKAPALEKVLTGDYSPQEYPAQMIQPVCGEILWLVDRSAASQLPASFTG